MSSTYRYPREAASSKGPSEATQVITLINASNAALAVGGPTVFVDISAWKLDGVQDESPYNCIQFEWTASGAIVIGDGTTLATSGIGLYGCRGDLTTGPRYLLGLLGMGFGNTFPQVRIISADVGMAQIVSMISSFDGIGIGGITAPIAVSDAEITVKARPWRTRNYVG